MTLKLYKGARVRTRNGETFKGLAPNAGNHWLGQSEATDEIRTWFENGIYKENVKLHPLDIVEIISDGPKPVIKRIERADVDWFSHRVENPDGSPINTLDHYQRIATKSAIYPGKGTPFGLMYAALGLAEAGEVQNKVKKAFRDDDTLRLRILTELGNPVTGIGEVVATYTAITPERRAQIIKELGGVLWYIAAVCDEINATMSEVALTNLDELCGRGERDTLRGDGDDR